MRTIPAVREIHERFKDRGLVVVGVHSPEFEREKDPRRVEEAVKRLGVPYPIALDNDLEIWRAFSNRYWPALYLLDRRGSARWTHVGELHRRTPEWDKLAREVERLLAEPPTRD